MERKNTTYKQKQSLSFRGTILSASSSESWCHVSPGSGSGDGTLVLTFDENTSDLPRDTSVYVESTQSGFVKKIEIKITQLKNGEQPKHMSISPSSLTIDYNGTPQTITVTGDTTWTVASNQSWCTVSPFSGSNDGEFTVSCTENSSDEDRIAEITVTGENANTFSIKVTQEKYNDEPTVEHFWYSDNYYIDIAVDDYMCNNYNMGQHTYGQSNGWDQQNKRKREYICNVAVIPAFDDRYIYGIHYAKYDPETGYYQVEREGYTYKRYNFTPLTSTEYNSQQEHHYKIEGPFAGISGINQTAMEYIQEVQKIGDFPGRQPLFDLNFGRVRPLGGAASDQIYRVQENPIGDSVGNIWNSLYNATLVSISVGDDVNDPNSNAQKDADINGDKATSYPSGHASQTWTMAMILLQAYHSSVNTGLEYVKNAYEIGVARTVGRFHWNSDTMYGRMFATQMMPIINAMGLSSNRYPTLCSELGQTPGNIDPATLTDESYSNDFLTLVGKFTDIVDFSGSVDVKRYLWSMYKLADNVLNTSNHVFLKQDTYPEVFPSDGHSMTIDGTSHTFKLRGTNTNYYHGSTQMTDVTRAGIMQSWLIALCLTELFLSNDPKSYTISNASSYGTTDQNNQTRFFARAYEIGGGRNLDFYHEYKIDYDPTILRLAACMVYVTERGKYSYSGVRGLSGATPATTLAGLNDYSSINCDADRTSKDFTVGWGVNTYFIYNDGSGPHKQGTYDSTHLKNPYELKSTIGTSTLKQQCQDKSLFCIGESPEPGDNNITYTIKMENHTAQNIDPEQNDGLSLYLEEQHLSIVVDLSKWTETMPSGGDTTFTANCHTNSSSSEDYISSLIQKGYHYKSSHYTGGEIDKAIRFYWPGHNSDTVFIAPLKGRLVGDKTSTMVLKIYDTIEEAEANA